MRLALLQARGTPGAVDANLEALATEAALAGAEGADLLITPETFLTGYDVDPGTLRGLAGSGIGEVGEIARAAGVAIACGWVERDGDRVYNAATLFDRRGEAVLTHRKCHLFGDVDRNAFDPGDTFAVADLDGVRVGLLICFDVEFPEAVRALALQGAQVIAVPTSLMAPYDAVAQTLVPARAVENHVFVAYCNRVGVERTLRYIGQSRVAGPDGHVIETAGAEEETLLIADIDLGEIDRARADFDYLAGRRPDLYGGLVR
jgi:predicted amidohydrolase